MKTALLIALTLLSGLAAAQGIYRWVDKDGKVHYTQDPPKNAQRVERMRGGSVTAAEDAPAPSSEMQRAATKNPVTVYTTGDCASACQDARDYLKKRGIPFTERAVVTEADMDALRALLGQGELAVPVLQVGDRSYKGFLEVSWAGLLDAAGYPRKKGPD